MELLPLPEGGKKKERLAVVVLPQKATSPSAFFLLPNSQNHNQKKSFIEDILN